MGAKLILSDKQLQRLNSEQLRRLGEIIVQNNPGASLTMEKSKSRYVNASVPTISFTGKLRISIDLIRQVGANVSLSELSRLAEFYTFVNGVLVISDKEILELK